MISNNVTGAAAYAAVQAGAGATAGTTGSDDTSFGAVMQNAITGLTALGQNADTMSNQALRGNGNMTDVVMAVSKAEMALQASVAVRDKMVSAYQEIMRMSV
jgi:flagellar hook-basal body complex protein FliE